MNHSSEITPFLGSMDLATVKAIAISSGDISVAVSEEVSKRFPSKKRNALRTVNEGLKELLERELITAKEHVELQTICKLFVEAVVGKKDAEDSFFAIRKAYQSMILNQSTSPVALAIASTANSSFNFVKSNSVTITPGNTGTGAVVGAIIGGIVGGLMGGGLGAGIGAAIGAAAGAAIGCSNE